MDFIFRKTTKMFDFLWDKLNLAEQMVIFL